MKRCEILKIVWVGVWVILLGGCNSTEHLLKTGRINAHREIPGEKEARLDVWVISARDAQGEVLEGTYPTSVLLHPWLTDKTWFLPLGEQLAREGWNVVLPDLRGHGQSGGTWTTWGALERRDILAVMDALRQEGLASDEIYAFGASLGGCTALLYAVDDPHCRGVVAVAPVDGVRGFIAQSSPFADEAARKRKVVEHGEQHGYDPADADPTAAGKGATIPLRLIWGLMDSTVPHEQTGRIFDAWAGPKEHELRLDNHGSIQWNKEGYFVEQLQKVRQMAGEGGKASTPTAP
jgi:pimeloyl-ACP methyl ester carboxylesterase